MIGVGVGEEVGDWRSFPAWMYIVQFEAVKPIEREFIDCAVPVSVFVIIPETTQPTHRSHRESTFNLFSKQLWSPPIDRRQQNTFNLAGIYDSAAAPLTLHQIRADSGPIWNISLMKT